MTLPVPIYPGPTDTELAALPALLKARPHWVLWRGVDKVEKKTGALKLNKVPYTTGLWQASTTDPATWAPYDRCVQALPVALEEWEADDPGAYRGGGLGYVFAPDDPDCGLDLDHVRDPATGQIAPWAEQLIRTFSSYTEISPTGTGAHMIAHAQLPGKGFEKSGAFGLYDRGRFFTMTGQVLGTPRPIVDRQRTVEALYSVKDVLTAALHQYGDRYSLLFAGRWQDARDAHGQPYPSQSEADLAFCTLGASVNGTRDLLDTLMHLSGLDRAKWGRTDYRTNTLNKAIEARNGTHTPAPAPSDDDWQAQLLLNQKNIPTENVSNLLLLLEHHPDWRGRFWWDTVRAQPMVGETPLDDMLLTDIARWCGLTLRMSIRSLKLIETCVRRVCQQSPRDLLQEWLYALPAWDGEERLTEWLADVASVDKTAYSMELARLIPVSMVARALEPGCQYRTVVVLEGPEDSGKSKLVRTLASPDWYVDFDVSMEGKEAYMLLQGGAWVAELGELATLSRTAEAKLKSFLTLQVDTWIPKYANLPVRYPRRTIFIGTVNPEGEYLKGQTGNTRFLPIKTGAIECPLLEAMRLQLFAEALVYYKDHPADWWQLSADGQTEARDHREARRQPSIYEHDLGAWLANLHGVNSEKVTWSQIARHFLLLEAPERWKDIGLQKQIAQAMRALGWTNVVERHNGRPERFWRKTP